MPPPGNPSARPKSPPIRTTEEQNQASTANLTAKARATTQENTQASCSIRSMTMIAETLSHFCLCYLLYYLFYFLLFSPFLSTCSRICVGKGRLGSNWGSL